MTSEGRPSRHAALPVSASLPILIFPMNGNALEALGCLDPGHHLLGFVDDTLGKQGTGPLGRPVRGRDFFNEHAEARVLAVPGSPTSFKSRRAVIESLGIDASRFATVVHPGAHISPLAEIGRNVLIMAGVVITSNAVIGDHVCVLPNTVIHHDVSVASFALIGSNVTLAGGVVVGESAYIGSGTSIMNGVRIGARSLVGLGSTVIRDCAPDSVVAGNPARLLEPG